MYEALLNMSEVKRKLDSVSPSFCMAKWLQSTIHLGNGTTHSCFLPPVHPIPLEGLKENPAQLHNTPEKKLQRRQMIHGQRPQGCHRCWAIEDLPDKTRVSDRILRASESWTRVYFNEIKHLKGDEDVIPTYLELSFSSLCNFKCSYCSPHVSTAWHAEIREHGPYQLSDHAHQNLDYLRAQGWMPIEDEDQNPYIDAFWKWWPEVYKKLHVFRLTGGEPLLSKHTQKLMNWVSEHPNPRLALHINSNFGVPEKVMDRFIDSTKHISEDQKVKWLGVHTSLDNFGPRAEYIRFGLDLELFDRNLRLYLNEIPAGQLAFMCTFNALSVEGFEEFLDYFIDLRREYETNERHLSLDIPFLTGPNHCSVKILPQEFEKRIETLIIKMESNASNTRGAATFRTVEIEKLKRGLAWMRTPNDPAQVDRWRKDFYLFFSEHDQRRGTDFLRTFPGMTDFWSECERLAKT